MKHNTNLYQETINLLAYIQLMGSFDPYVDFKDAKNIVVSSYEFIKNSTEAVLEEKLPEVKIVLEKIAKLYIKRYPPRESLEEIATSFNDFFNKDHSIYVTGLEFGWLESRMDLKKLNLYPDLPYHFKIGIGHHKGNGGIEEDNLLKDAFNTLIKVEQSANQLYQYGQRLKEKEEEGNYCFTQESYKLITDIKYEVCFYCRLSVIAFYSFVECFINSVGFNFLYRNRYSLTETEIETLRGFKKGRYCRLDYKIEKYQMLIRVDRTPIFVTSDPSQIQSPFKEFFESYESLRNASVHYSPEKDKIWLSPQEWEKIAKEFSQTAINVALQFWKACYPLSDGPNYLGKLDYDLHKRLAAERKDRISKINEEIRFS